VNADRKNAWVKEPDFGENGDCLVVVQRPRGEGMAQALEEEEGSPFPSESLRSLRRLTEPATPLGAHVASSSCIPVASRQMYLV
jgi:hypothetical protein